MAWVEGYVETCRSIDTQLFQTTGQVAVQAAAKRGELGIATGTWAVSIKLTTGVFYTGMSLGGTIGVALSGAVWNNILPDALAEKLPAESKNMAKQLCESRRKRDLLTR